MKIAIAMKMDLIRTHIAVLIALALSIGAVYGTAVKYGFAFEDFLMLAQGPKPWHVMARHIAPASVEKYDLEAAPGKDSRPYWGFHYRPTMEFFYYFHYRLLGLQPVLMHIENLLFHLLNCFLVFLIGLRIFKDSRAPAFFVSFFFAVSPALFYVMFAIVYFQDIVTHFVFFFGLFMVMKGRHNIALAAFILGLLSKETAIIMPAVLILYEFLIEERKEPRYFLKKYWSFFLTGAVYIAIKEINFDPIPKEGPYAMVFFDWRTAVNAWDLIKDTVGNFLLIPFFNSMEKYTPLATALFITAALPALFLSIRKAGWRVPAFAFSWFLLSLLPYIFVINHFQYYYIGLANFGFMLGVVFVARTVVGPMVKYRKAAAAAFAGVYLLLAGINVHAHEKIDRSTARPVVAADIMTQLKEMYPRVPPGTKFIFLTPWRGAIENALPIVMYGDLSLLTLNTRHLQSYNDGESNFFMCRHDDGRVFKVNRGEVLVFLYSFKNRKLFDVSESFYPDAAPSAMPHEMIMKIMDEEAILMDEYKMRV